MHQFFKIFSVKFWPIVTGAQTLPWLGHLLQPEKEAPSIVLFSIASEIGIANRAKICSTMNMVLPMSNMPAVMVKTMVGVKVPNSRMPKVVIAHLVKLPLTFLDLSMVFFFVKGILPQKLSIAFSHWREI